MKTVPVDGALFRRRRLGARDSLRDASRSTHLTVPSLTRMESEGVLSGATSLADFERLAAYAGLSPAELLADPGAPADGQEGAGPLGPEASPDGAPASAGDGCLQEQDDVRDLGCLLAHDSRLHRRDAVARALGWDLDRLARAQARLDAALRPAGVKVRHLRGSIGLQPADASRDKTVAALAEHRAADNGLAANQARLVHQALQGALRPNTVKKGDLPALNELVNLGVLEHVHRGGHDSVRLTPDAAHAFDVPVCSEPAAAAPGPLHAAVAAQRRSTRTTTPATASRPNSRRNP